MADDVMVDRVDDREEVLLDDERVDVGDGDEEDEEVEAMEDTTGDTIKFRAVPGAALPSPSRYGPV